MSQRDELVDVESVPLRFEVLPPVQPLDADEASRRNALGDMLMAQISARYPREKMNATRARFTFCDECGKHHAYITGVRGDTNDWKDVQDAAHYFWGAEPKKGLWWRKDADGTYSAEVVDMCDVASPPKFPWDWCGTTYLFLPWKRNEKQREANKQQRTANLKHSFKVGDTVKFRYQGQELIGLVTGMRTRLTVVVPGVEATYHIIQEDIIAKMVKSPVQGQVKRS